MPAKTLPLVRPAQLKAIDRSRELLWLSQHRREYFGEWVVLNADQLIGHGKSLESIMERARALGIERPLVVRIEEDDLPRMGGWL